MKLKMGNWRVEQVANKRLAICRLCDFNVQGICSKKKPTIINNVMVSGCNCPINQKVYSMKGACPKGLWTAEYNIS